MKTHISNFLMKKFTIILFIFTTIFACTNQQLPEPVNVTPLTKENDFDVSLDDAIKVSKSLQTERFNDQNKYVSNLRGDIVEKYDKEIDKIEIVKNKDEKSVFNVINYKDKKGFTIISSDNRMTPILAYSDNGSFNIKDTASNNGIKIWYSIVESAFEKGIKLPKADKSIKSAWDKYLNNSTKKGRIKDISCWTPPNIQVGPLTAPLSEWGQDYGYKFFCPTRGGSCQCDKALAGCGPVALAQMLRYDSKTFLYNNHIYQPSTYSSMPHRIINVNAANEPTCDGFTPGELNVAQLIRDCGLMTSTNYNWPTTNCQSWTEPDDIPWGFAAAGYSQIGTKVFFYDNIGLVDNELQLNRPVVMKGSTCNACFWKQHIWVLDGIRRNFWYDVITGYDEYGYYYENCVVYSSTEYHQNWGMDTSNNGWYTLYGFIGPGDDTYNASGMRVFINIRP